MSDFKWFASLILSATMVPALTAETRCPGNVASLPFRLVNSHQMIVAVSVNHAGPYSFLLDTGLQVTMISPSLAAELHLKSGDAAVVAGAGSSQSALLAQVDLLEAGSHAVASPKVVVYDLQKMSGAELHIEGILGLDFLRHFDLLIDIDHHLLCLDGASAMRTEVRGPRIALLPSLAAPDSSQMPSLAVVEARLSDASRPVRLMLDSGANGAVLFNTSDYLGLPRRVHLQGTGVDGRQLIFSALPPQDVKIGSLKLSRVPFVSLAGTQKDSRAKGFDGVLTLGLFRRVFIAYADHFAILDPK